MATTEPGISPPATTSEVGRHLRSVRKAQGLSRSEVARSAGLTRRELAAYERGRIPVPDSDLWCLAGSCGVDVSELLPSRDKLVVNSDLGSLTIGDSVARLRTAASSDGLLREYLAMIYELRNLPPGTRPPMREEDLAALADALGGTPEAIEARLHELIGVQRDEAARLRAMILPPRSLPAASATPLPDLSAYASTPYTPFDAPDATPAPAFDFAMAPTTVGDPDATDRFFAAPRVDDPFASPPPLEPLAALAPFDSAPAAAAVEAAFDPFAPPTALPIDPFGPAAIDGPPAPPASPGPPPMPTFDPFAPMPEATHAPVDAPAAFDPATFDPEAFATEAATEPEVPDLFAPEPNESEDGAPLLADLGDDPAYAIEVVALGPDEPAAATVEPTELDPRTPVDPQPGESWLATWEELSEHTRGDDPFAALRVPLEEVYGGDVEAATADPFGPEPGFDTPAFAATELPADVPTGIPTEAVEVVPDVDPFADAFEPVEELEPTPAPADIAADVVAAPTARDPFPGTGVDDEPDGEWFDRAAAATAALVADHFQTEPHPEPEASVEEPVEASVEEPWLDEALEAPTTHAVAEPVEDSSEALDEDALEDAEIAEALAAAPVAGLAPISWSLFPPASTDDDVETSVEEPEAFEMVETVETVEAVEETTEAAADAPVASDTQFVTAGTEWQIGGIFPATAMADDGTLALRRADVRWALADLVAGDDFTARATVDFTSGAGFGVLFRVSVDDSERISGYSFDVDPIYGGGGFLLRQWHDNKQHWKPLAHAPVADPTRLYGHHTIEVQLRADQLTASVDGDVVLTVRQLSRCSIDSGREPCRGARLGIQAWSTTEVTVDRLMLAAG